MIHRIETSDLLHSSRGRVYLTWAAICGIGFVTTHFYQDPNINPFWFVISAIGFFYMFRVMPLRVQQTRNIYLSWLIPIVIGIAISGLAVRTGLFPSLVGYLGPFWLLVMAVGYFWNGLSDIKGGWYYVAAGINVVAAGLIYTFDGLLPVQYLLAAVVTVWSMLMIWAFYSDL